MQREAGKYWKTSLPWRRNWCWIQESSEYLGQFDEKNGSHEKTHAKKEKIIDCEVWTLWKEILEKSELKKHARIHPA